MSPTLNGEWIKQSTMNVFVGGAELNVANALAKWDMPVKYFSAIPDHFLSKEITAHLQQNGIDASAIKFSGSRIGTYYLPQGSDLKNAGVIYDRACSSFSELKRGDIDWQSVLADVDWLHFSAISPALTEDTAAVCKEALEAASQKGITISVDLNYRAKLWQYGKQPLEVMPELIAYCNVIMGNIWSAASLLGITPDEALLAKTTKASYLQQSADTANAIMQQYPQCNVVANTFRFDRDKGIEYYATLHKKNEQQFVSRTFYADEVIDKVGSGDCFMGGLIYGIKHAHPPQQIIDFAAAAAVGKMQIVGDCTTQTIEEIQQTVNSEK